MSIRRNQAKLGEKSAAMAIWLGKQYLGQRDNEDIKVDAHPMLKELADILNHDE